MVWIHGGSYQSGQGMQYDGRELALEGNVIVVTINYRLGAFGFFTTGDEISRGNYGLWDQSFALRWIHENIDSFGGDRNSVTIFGESAGGDSCTFQSLFPGNKGFFQRVIAQSGVATDPLYFSKERRIEEESSKFLRRIGCFYSDRIAAINCARTVPASVILEKQPPALSVIPIVDGEIIIGTPALELLDKTSEVYRFFTSLDYMAGSLDGDGAAFLGLLPASSYSRFNVRPSQGLTTEYLCDFVAGYLANLCCPGDVQVANEICKTYTDTRSLESQSIAISTLLADALLTFPKLFTAEVHQSENLYSDSTYSFYITRFNPVQFSLFPDWSPPWLNRASHGMDFVYLFFAREVFQHLGQYDDIEFGIKIKKYWANFAKYGNPNGPFLPFWPSYGANRNTQVLDLTIRTVSNIFPEKNRFWIDFTKKSAFENGRSCFSVFRYGRRIPQCVASKRKYPQTHFNFK
ncbi:hypothetical protein FSP39_004721 [Pinctada imbricata]|uniref:Carboxylic ester hydrolase n=1 Tax=Pinctada imbricata TaxID=66713 RepID=A0AA89C4N4_PINIB|nr:hypothetical protein FSP39_004721 [Pinctada imbricata]